ncbi:hypothetical protein H1230_02515 [Paenibacillus sp. 19GGS1-52]|uniref:hypothetical protein n=1 Tax=Paenibacillus sp. 19GGS1-52 TaxID=2758563 RepID=UPI001EFAB479|nr:hypothetical protein [Paenibacillus sp. 19GGS1-52]ULO07762.1 hypothetical protein H1230_02515 [Paenibacillus sp. 19GGS1-52]
MYEKVKQLNTLRQIFIGFLLVMLIIISVAGAFVYDRVAYLLKNNAERHIERSFI